MKTNVSKPESWKRVVDFEIPEEELASGVHAKITEYKKRVSLPGFRPGKVPENLIQSRYGDAIRAEVVENIINKSYKKACEDHGINPVSEGKVSKLNAEPGSPLTFTIEAEIEPDVEIKGYDKLKIRPRPKKVKRSHVDEAVEDLRGRLAEFKDVDRPAEKGDYVSIDYVKVVIDGEEKKGVNAPNYPIELGAGKIKEFDKQIQNHKVGETVAVSMKFPGDYSDGELAGKKGELAVSIKKVQERILPEINEEFLKKLGEFASEDALREKIQTDLEHRESERARNEAFNEAIETLIKKNNFEVPPSRVETYIDAAYQEATQYAQPGAPVPSREQVAERYREAGIRFMKRLRIIDYIAAQEKLKPTQEEVDAEIKKIADYYQQPFEQVKETLRRNGTVLRIRTDLRETKVMNFLLGEPEVIDEQE